MRHLDEIVLRFDAEVRAIQMPDIPETRADLLYSNYTDAREELGRADNEFDYELAAQKLKHTVALLLDFCKKKAAKWAAYESAHSALLIGITDALEKDKRP